MAVNVSGEGSLYWAAGIDLTDFDKNITSLVKGLETAAKKGVEFANQQNDAFQQSAEAMNAAGEQAKKIQTAFEGFTNAKNKVAELQDELSKLKAPGFTDGKSALELENINRYIAQQEKLLLDLKQTTIDYAKELAKLSNTEIQAPTIETPQVDKISFSVTNAILAELKKEIGDIDPITESFIQKLITLELKLQEIGKFQSEVDAAFQTGKISEQQYTEVTAFLVATISNVTEETKLLTEQQKAYENGLRSSAGTIADKKAALAELVKAYEQLTAAQRESPEGVDMAKQISALKTEIKGLQPGEIIKTTEATITAQAELKKLKALMLEQPDSPLFNEWKTKAGELTESIGAVKTSVEQATNSTAGVEAFASGLRSLIGGFSAATGVIGLFTDDTAEYEKVTKNATSALALLNGIQEVSNVLSKTSALNIYLRGLAQKASAAATTEETAAIVANTAATETQIVATEAAAGAQKGLAAAVLANPAAFLVAGIAALAAAYLLLKKNAGEAKTATELLNDANKKVTDSYAEKLAKVLPLVEAVKQGNLSEQQSIEIHKELLQIDEKLVQGLNAKALAYDALQVNVNAYAESLRKQFRIEANSEAITASIKNEERINQQLKERKKFIEEANAAVKAGKANSETIGLINVNRDEVDKLTKDLIEQKKTTDDLVKSNVELSRVQGEKAKRGTAEIDKDIAAIKELQAKNAETSQEYIAYQKQINALEAERRAITGASKAEINRANKEENKLLAEQKNLLELINNLKRDATQSGLEKEASALDKINEKYDLALLKITDFNKKAPKDLQIDTTELQRARAVEIQNQSYRSQAETYKNHLDGLKKTFEEYEQTKAEIGTQKANEMFTAQTGGAKSYLEYLQKQKADIEKAVKVGPAEPLDLGQLLKLQAIGAQLKTETERLNADAFKTQLENYKTLLQATVTYEEQKAAIIKKYTKLESDLEKEATIDPALKAQKLKVLEASKKDELDAAQETVFQHTELYKKMNADILDLSAKRTSAEMAAVRAQIKEELSAAKELAKPGATITDTAGNVIKLTDEQRRKILAYIKELQQAEKQTRAVLGVSVSSLDKFAEDAGKVADGFHSTAEALRPLNEDLANAVERVGLLANGVADAASAAASFASGDIIGGIVSSVSAIGSIVGGLFGSESPEEKRRKEEAKQLLTDVYLAEFSINELYRERARQQVLINKLKLQGLKDEANLLQSQLTSNQADFNRLFIDLQKERYKLLDTENAVGIAETLSRTRSLAGLSFDEIEKLFLSNRLTDKAKELFEELQKLKQEGVDIDAALEQNKKNIQETFTGTTAESITDSIIEGFANGYKAPQDFADNFQKVMKQAVLNSLKYQALEKPLQEFYQKFADAAQSDNVLTAAEISQLQSFYDKTINAAAQQFDQLKQITQLNFNDANSVDGNSLQGAIKGITQQQADLLAGQFGGLRLTAIEALAVGKSQLNALNEIANNTYGIRITNEILRNFQINGIKVN